MGAHGARNNERHVCARCRVGEAARSYSGAEARGGLAHSRERELKLRARFQMPTLSASLRQGFGWQASVSEGWQASSEGKLSADC